MVPNNLIDYIKVYDKVVPTCICEGIVKDLKKNNFQLHHFYSPRYNSHFSHKNEPFTSFDDIPHSLELRNYIWKSIERYILKDFVNFREWFPGWEGFSHLKFNKYEVGSTMNIHCDHIREIFDGNIKGVPILSIVLLLNDDFEGGEFVMWEDSIINLTAGSVLIFPSNFLFPHRVKEIKKGTRFTCVSWVW